MARYSPAEQIGVTAVAAYDEHGEEESEWDAFGRAQDEDNGVFHEQRSADDIYPYDASNGEVESYRLQLFLSPLGDAYLAVADHLAEPETKSPFDPDVIAKLKQKTIE